MTQNPLWPLIDIAVAFNAGPASAMPAPYWRSMNARSMGTVTTNRGRQYELDQVQTGTWAGSLENTDAALDPANSSSPFSPQVRPYRAFRHRAQYPATINILTPDQATAGKASGLALGVLPPWVSKVTAGAMTLTTAAFSGSSNKYLLAYGASNTVGAGVALTGFSVVAGSLHAMQCAVSASANNGLQMQLSIQWISAVGGLISTSTGTAVTTTTGTSTVSVVGTAPANACGAILRLLSSNSVVSATSISALQIQAEYNPSISAYVTPNTWYSIFTGYVERWPQSWSMNGQFGQSDLTVVDAFGYLSQRKVLSSAYEELTGLTTAPTFFYPLDESPSEQPSIVPLFYDLTATRIPVTVSSPNTPTSDSKMVPGNALSASGGYLPQGIGGPVLGMGLETVSLFSVQSLDLTAGGVLPPGPATPVWTRILAFQTPQQPTLANTTAVLFNIVGAGASPVPEIVCKANYDSLGNYGGNVPGQGLSINWFQGGSNTAEMAVNASVTNNMSDGGWHLLIFGQSGATLQGWYDGAPMIAAISGLSTMVFPSSGVDAVGGDGFGNVAPFGNIAFLAEFPILLSSAQASTIYSAFRYGGSGLGAASSFSRYQDILRWGNWIGAQAVDNFTSGETVAYGPATEMNAAASDPGTDVVSMLQTVVDTDAGTHYAAVDGTVTFKARRARYNQTTPVVIFGENTGEVPYTVVNTGYDPTRVANDISILQTQTSATLRVIDQNSANTYGDIQLQRTVNTLNPLEQSDAASYLLLRNSQPVQRIEGISVNVGANPALWPTILALELGTRVRVMRRPPLGAATIQVDGFVEQLNWTFDDSGNASVDLQISVNNQQQYWQLDSSTFSVLNSTTIIGY